MSVHYQIEGGPVAAPGPPMPHVEGVEHRFVDVRGVSLHVAAAGEGEPVVLLHGWPQHWWQWRKLIPALAQRHRVICPDFRGMGWSEAPPAGYSLWAQLDDLLGILDALELDRVRLVGHDWGQLVGYLAALQAPERISRYVASGGVHPWSAMGSSPLIWLRPWHIYVQATRLSPFLNRRLGYAERLLGEWRHHGRFTDEEVRTYLDALLRPGSLHATHQRYRSIVLREIAWFVRRQRDVRLRVPTLHLNGADDPLTQGMPDSWRPYADDMRVELIPDCGHFPHEEQPERMADRVLEFLG